MRRDRTPLPSAPTWTARDRRYYGSDGVCMRCKQPMKVGDRYWLNAGDMCREPPRPFHADCEAG